MVQLIRREADDIVHLVAKKVSIRHETIRGQARRNECFHQPGEGKSGACPFVARVVYAYLWIEDSGKGILNYP